MRAEPRGIGTAGARDPLAREVKLLGALLGQVIVEQRGLAALELVERVRKTTIALRRQGAAPGQREHLASTLDALTVDEAELLIRAFSLYFQLTNLAEEKQRVRRLRKRQRADPRGIVDESIAAAVGEVRRKGITGPDVARLVGRLSLQPVLTAHPTEARRRTLLVALRRIYRLLDQLDDPRLTPNQNSDIRRRLRAEITILWHTSPIRGVAPSALDEVRTGMAFFDETLFTVTPRFLRTLSDAAGGVREVGGALRWGTWMGGDRDGNPHVTAETTRHAMRIQADHVLRAYEAVAARLMQTISANAHSITAALTARLESDRRDLPELGRQLDRRFPDEPFRRRLGYIGERLRRARGRLTGEGQASNGYSSPAALMAELDELSEAVAHADLERVASGDLQDFRWQVAVFGFHGLSLELRQHSDALELALAAPAEADPQTEVAAGVTLSEVLATFRAMADLQRDYGVEACRRFVVSFTRSANDVSNVLKLARRACPDDTPVIDVVPLFESADALASAGAIVDEFLADAEYKRHLNARGGVQEVMLGYSDSTKESGSLAAAWMLYRAQQQLVEVCRRHSVELVLFHGRGGAIGRGGGPMTRAVLAQAPGSVDAHLKVTEQGEVIADRYANPDIALRHLEQMSYAALVASTPQHDEKAGAAAAEGADILDELTETARDAYRTLVWDDPAFDRYFRAATPIDELSELAIGSRPAKRAARVTQTSTVKAVASLRAIPWVFAWSQSRANLPGWYGTGTALSRYIGRHGDAGRTRLRELYRSWPLFASVLDNTELVLAKADMLIASRYASLAASADGGRIWRMIEAEHDRTVVQILAITGHARLLEDVPVLRRSIDLRNPYVDSLSEIQVRLLDRLRSLDADDPARVQLTHLVLLSVSGVAAGLQNTG